MISRSRSSWRRNASSKTVWSTSLGRKLGRVPAAGGGEAPSAALARSLVGSLLHGRNGDGVEDRADGRLAGDALGLALEVEDDPVAKGRQGDGPDVVGRDVEPAI